MAIPLQVNDQFTGMLGAVVSLDSILHRLEETSVRGRTVFVVDHNGHVMAHPDSHEFRSRRGHALDLGHRRASRGPA